MNQTDLSNYRAGLAVVIGLSFAILALMFELIDRDQGKKRLVAALLEQGYMLIEAHIVYFDLKYLFSTNRYQRLWHFTATTINLGKETSGTALIWTFLGMGGVKIDWS